MKKIPALLTLLLLALPALAEDAKKSTAEIIDNKQIEKIDDVKLSKKMLVHLGNKVIVIGDDLDENDNAALRHRVHDLEFAMKILYLKLGFMDEWLESREPKYLCSIETDVDVYSATAKSESEAKMKAVEECKKRENFGKRCNPKKAECSKGT